MLARLRRGAIVATTIAIAFSVAPALTALADPADPAAAAPTSQPSTAADAKDAWLAASEQAEALNEQVLQADEAVTVSTQAVTAANDAVTAATAEVVTAQQATVAAQAVVASYDTKLDAFANASFRGARMSELSSLLTSDSADDFLDSVTALDKVAGDTSDMLQQARDAKTAADAAAVQVQTKEAAAEAAQQSAVTANSEAVAAQSSLTASKAALDTQVANYETLYNQLTEQERQAAIAAEQARLAAQAAAAAAAAAAAQAAAPAAVAPGAAAPDQGDATSIAVDGTSAAAPVAKAAATTASVVAPNAAAQIAVDAALSKVGSKYVFGAAGPNQFDCSGLTSWAWAQAGVSIPRTSSGQAGLTSVPMNQLEPGDLVTYYSPVHHVAMYIGNGQIVHASTASKPVYVTSVNYGGPNASGHRVQ